ncbi:MAG: STAS domain-containing protein [Fuerstia sp.]|nr:STAS domain-containing protein [Fuerstiella sp.]
MSGFVFEKHSTYCVLCFTPQLEAMTQPDVENATAVVPELVRGARTHAVLVDLSRLQKIPVGLLTALVRAWKAMEVADRRFVVFATQTSIREELKQTGLDGLWTVVDSADASVSALKATDDAGDVIDPATHLGNGRKTLSNSPDAPIRMQSQKRFNSVQFLPTGMTMSWHEVEAATNDVVRRLRESEHLNVMVDLSQMPMINSGLIASLVRIWKVMKERNGQFSLVSPNENVTEVLKTAGLWKLWSVVENREEAVYELGVSKAAIVEKRERRFLMLVAAPCSVIAALALIPMFLQRSEVLGVNAQLTALLFASAAVATGLISVLKDSGLHRIVSCIAVAIGILVLSSLAFEGSPVSFSRGALKTDSTDQSN